MQVGHGSTLNPVGGKLIAPTPRLNLGIAHQERIRRGTEGEYQYLHLLQECVNIADHDPTPKKDRTGTGTYGVFGRQIKFDAEAGFPLLTTKKLFTRGIIAELLWMLAGETNIKSLVEQNVHIWDEWADENGELGPVYGAQWRTWGAHWGQGNPGVDQIAVLLHNLKTKPYDRGHVVSAWNAADLDRMALRPCHCLFQVQINNGRLNLQLYQRSADIFLGVPFNIASYAILMTLLARELDLQPGVFTHTFGDLHLYANHVQQAREQLKREPRRFPALQVKKGPSLFELVTEDIRVIDYDPHPSIKGDVSV
jgi:thymidylate synthase